MNLLKQFLKDPLTIGSIADTSKYTAQFIAGHIPDDSYVVELGSGNWAISKHIINKHLLITVDKNVESDRPSHFKADVFEFIRPKGPISNCDVIVSSLPTILFTDVQLRIYLDLIKKFKKENTLFIQLNYSKTLTKEYEKRFEIISQTRIWRNIPPAIITIMK